MKSLSQVLADARQHQTAIPAFNIDSFEIYQAVESVVADINQPCIVQLSSGEDSFIQAERLFILVQKARLDGLPIYLNMDHGKDSHRLLHLLRLGFDMVHFDGSSLDYSQNLSQTAEFIAAAKNIRPDCLIEAEFNRINLVDSQISPDSFTQPSQAAEFIAKTGADLLAVSIGNLHGVSQKSVETIDLDLLSQIKSALPQQFLTLHGGSGISSDQLNSAINMGVVKININTDLRRQFFQSLKANLSQYSGDKIYQFFDPVITDLKSVIKSKFHV